MTKKRKPTLGKTLINLVLALPTVLSIVGRIGSLVSLETRLAGRSLVSMVMLAFLCILLLTSSWLCILAMLFVFLTSLLWSIQIVLLSLLGLNLFTLLIVCYIITRCKKRLSFPQTRYLLDEARSIFEN